MAPKKGEVASGTSIPSADIDSVIFKKATQRVACIVVKYQIQKDDDEPLWCDVDEVEQSTTPFPSSELRPLRYTDVDHRLYAN